MDEHLIVLPHLKGTVIRSLWKMNENWVWAIIVQEGFQRCILCVLVYVRGRSLCVCVCGLYSGYWNIWNVDFFVWMHAVQSHIFNSPYQSWLICHSPKSFNLDAKLNSDRRQNFHRNANKSMRFVCFLFDMFMCACSMHTETLIILY